MDFGNLEEHTEQNQQGRGLGLSICKSIIEKMGGSISVTSKLNQGSEFTINLNMICCSKKFV